MANLVPPSLRPIAHYVKLANEYAQRDVVIHYWALFYAVQTGMRIDKKSPDAIAFLGQALGSLEALKKANTDKDGLTQDVVAQAYIENHALKLFAYADENDRNSNFNKNVVKAFYTAGIIFDVLCTFGELDENIAANRKYAKWKATYIHNCLKKGETPVPGPFGAEGGGMERSGEGSLDVPPPAPNLTDFSEFSANQDHQTPNPHAGYSSDSSLNHPTPFDHQHQQPPPQPHFNQPSYSEGSVYGFQQPPAPHQPTPPPRPSVQPGHGSLTHQHVPNPASSSASASASSPAIHAPMPMKMAPASNLKLEDYLEARKYCKYGMSAIDYEDAPTAIENMLKSIRILQGQEP